jgi:hypothetical protein
MCMGVLYSNSNKLPKYKPGVVYTSTTIQTLGSYLYAELVCLTDINVLCLRTVG